MNIPIFKSLDIKRKIGLTQILLNLILLAIFIPQKGIRYSPLLFILFFAVLLFRFKPVPLRKYSYLSLTNIISILLYLQYGPVTAAFWIFVFLLVADIIFEKGLFQAMVNGSAYALSTFIAGSIVGIGIINSWHKLFIFFLIHYILQNGIFFYLPEFISRKPKRQEIIYIHSWEIFYYILAAIAALSAYKVMMEPTTLKISIFGASFLILRYFIRNISKNAIEGATYRDLLKLQSEAMKRSFVETVEAVVLYSNQYVDWTGLNISRVNHKKDEVIIIYSSSKEVEVDLAIPINKGITGKCVREKRPIIVRDTESSDEYMALRSNVRSEMVLPLLYSNTVIGTLGFEHNLIGIFTEKEVEYAQFFASLLTYALQTNISLQPLVSTSEKLKGFTEETYRTTNELREEMDSIQEKMKNIISGGEKQIRSLGEVEIALEELLSSHENVKTLREKIHQGVEEFNNILTKSRNSVEENFTLLNEIAEAIKAVEETVEPLTTLSGNVMKVANSSKEVAEDTSLLALNASIEAARTSGQGGAFSIIAEEINELAKTASSNSDEITLSAKNIMNDVRELTNKTSKVVMATKNIEIASSSIMEQFNRIGDQLSSIQEGLNETIEVSKQEIENIEALGARIEQSAEIGKENIDFIKNIDRLIENQQQVIRGLNEEVTNIKASMERLRSIVEEFRLTHEENSSF